jgi:hypothetical protein
LIDHLHFWTIVSKHDATDKFDNIRRSRMTIAEKDAEADLHAAILEKDSRRITSAYIRGADLIAGVLRSQSKVVCPFLNIYTDTSQGLQR